MTLPAPPRAPVPPPADRARVARPGWRPGLIDRYLLAELMGPFLFGVAAFTCIMTASSVLFDLVRAMVRFGLSFWVVAEVLLLRLPEMVFYTFPMSMLLAALLTFGRLSGDLEITAMRACGVSLPRILFPCLVAAALVSGATIALNEYVVPPAKQRARLLLEGAQGRQKLPVARENLFHDEFEHGRLKRLFHAQRFDGVDMQGVTVQEFDGPVLARIVQARRARWLGGGWRFEDGTLYQIGEDGGYRYVATFKTRLVRLQASLAVLAEERKDAMEMTLAELGRHLDQMQGSGRMDGQVRELGVQWHQKLSIPFASLVFALVGAPLGLRPQRSSNAIGLGVSILVIFAYYVAMFLFTALGQAGHLSPVWAAWAPNLIGGGIGIALVVRASRQ
ncbi:MAG: LptF/LptG family permease [Candidatus Sericytochromatia bacterium]|nr:LptF/LptG family permease [Candidatus Sericytochromatia bacterium]